MKKIKTGSIIVNPSDILQGSVQDQIEDRSIYLRSDDNITWTGTQIDFTSDIVLDIINTASGTIKSFTVAVAQSPVALADGESAYISIDRTTSAAATIVKSGTVAIPAHSNADKDIFVLFRRKDTAGAEKILHIPLHKQALEEGQSVRLGASGAGAGGGLDTVHAQDFETTAVASFTSGLNATYKTAGTFGGTLADETTNPISGEQSPKYTAGVTSTNDWFDVETITLDDKQRSEDIGITLYADMTNMNTDVEFVVWDNTNSAKLNSSLDILEGGTAKSRYSFSVYIPSTTASISYGFHMVTAPVSTEYFVVDDVELSTNPFVYKNLIDTHTITYTGYTSRTADKFLLPTEAENNNGGLVIASSAGSYTRYTFTRDVTFTATASRTGTAAHTSILQYNSSDVQQLYAADGSIVAGSASMTSLASAGDYLIMVSNSIGANDTTTFFSVTATAETEHVITPAKSSETTINVLSADHTTIADIGDLQFSSLEIGKRYKLDGQMNFNLPNGTTNEVKFFSGTGGTGTQYGAVRDIRIGTGNSGIIMLPVSIEFTAVSTSLHIYHASTAAVLGDTSKNESFLQLTNIHSQFLAAIPKNFHQTKLLTADVSADTASISDLLFSGLTIGKTYRVTGQAAHFTDDTAGDHSKMIILNNGSAVAESKQGYAPGGTGSLIQVLGVCGVFVAAATTMVVSYDEVTSSSLQGNNTRNETYLTLEECNYSEETTRFT